MKSKILILFFVVSLVAGMIVPTTAIAVSGENPNLDDNDGIPDLDVDGGSGGGKDHDGIPDLDGRGNRCTL